LFVDIRAKIQKADRYLVGYNLLGKSDKNMQAKDKLAQEILETRLLMESNGKAISALTDKMEIDGKIYRHLIESNSRAIAALGSTLLEDRNLNQKFVSANSKSISDLIDTMKEMQLAQKMLIELVQEQQAGMKEFKVIINSFLDCLRQHQNQSKELTEIIQEYKHKLHEESQK